MAGRNDTMPVLEELAGQAAEAAGGRIWDTVVLHINHCIDNSFYFSQMLDGLFCRAVFVGTPYNDTGIDSRWTFVRYCARNKGHSYELWEEDNRFDQDIRDFTRAVERLIVRALENSLLPWLLKGKRLLILEDGGYHFKALGRFLNRHPELENQICGSVEQTSSGTLRGRAYGLKNGFSYPCASISRSDIKMYVEARFIGHRIVEELAGFFYTANVLLDFCHVLLVGYGIVGRQVAMDLKGRNCRIHVYDTDPRIAAVADREGFQSLGEVTDRDFYTNTLVIGSTGTSSFTKEMLGAFFDSPSQELYLASGSSQDVEFKSFLKMVGGEVPWPAGVKLTGCRKKDYYTEYEFFSNGMEKRVLLFAEGLPVNFYRKGAVSLTYSMIDLIFAEMLSMGMALHDVRDIGRHLWLLGDPDGIRQSVTEEELMARWLECYGLAGAFEAGELLKGHPEGVYLRNKVLMAEEEG